jgi:hypothetical protein
LLFLLLTTATLLINKEQAQAKNDSDLATLYLAFAERIADLRFCFPFFDDLVMISA